MMCIHWGERVLITYLASYPGALAGWSLSSRNLSGMPVVPPAAPEGTVEALPGRLFVPDSEKNRHRGSPAALREKSFILHSVKLARGRISRADRRGGAYFAAGDRSPKESKTLGVLEEMAPPC